MFLDVLAGGLQSQHHPLVADLVRDADHHGMADTRYRLDPRLVQRRVDGGAAAHDHVLLAPQEHHGFLAQDRQVAGGVLAQPRLAEVTLGQMRTRDDQLAVGGEPCGDAGEQPADQVPFRIGDQLVDPVGDGDGHDLGHAVDRQDPDPGQYGRRPVDQRGQHRRAADQDLLQRRGSGGQALGDRSQHRGQISRHQEGVRGPVHALGEPGRVHPGGESERGQLPVRPCRKGGQAQHELIAVDLRVVIDLVPLRQFRERGAQRAAGVDHRSRRTGGPRGEHHGGFGLRMIAQPGEPIPVGGAAALGQGADRDGPGRHSRQPRTGSEGADAERGVVGQWYAGPPGEGLQWS